MTIQSESALPAALRDRWPHAPHYANANGWRMHDIDEGKGDPVVLLFGNPTWGFLYRDMIAPLVGSGRRVIVPDMIGFGLSEKPTREQAHCLDGQAAALICFCSAILYLPLYLGLSLSSLTQASEGELVFQSIYQGIMMSVVALFAFNRAVVLLGPRAAAVIIALVPVMATLLPIPVLGDWPSAAAICIIALGVGLAATSSNQGNKKGENQ